LRCKNLRANNVGWSLAATVNALDLDGRRLAEITKLGSVWFLCWLHFFLLILLPMRCEIDRTLTGLLFPLIIELELHVTVNKFSFSSSDLMVLCSFVAMENRIVLVLNKYVRPYIDPGLVLIWTIGPSCVYREHMQANSCMISPCMIRWFLNTIASSLGIWTGPHAVVIEGFSRLIFTTRA
jgi:hypothetical protein